MFRKFNILLLLLLSSYVASGQSSMAKNAVYLELLGNAGVYSLNYERAFSPNFNLRAGFGTSFGGFWSQEDVYIQAYPVMGNYLFGSGSSRFELGGGFLLGSKEIENSLDPSMNRNITIFDLTGVLGYRYQHPEGGFLFRIGLTPFLALTGGDDAYPDKGFFPSGGMSLGYAF